MSALQDTKRCCRGMTAEAEASSCSAAASWGLLRMPKLRREQQGKAQGEVFELEPLFDLMPKQLIVLATVSPQASWRPLFIGIPPFSCCVCHRQNWKTRVSESFHGWMECRGTIAAAVTRPGLILCFAHKKVCRSQGCGSGCFWYVEHSKSFAKSTEASA